jgi:asparagine synthase (glutamine-hydrolysing)
MSGLAVLFNRDGRRVDESAIRGMLDAIPYRGPDGLSVRMWGPLAFGYAKLAVTPEEDQEHQPLVSSRTGCMLVADVRLDNRAELLARLPVSAPVSASDAVLVLLAYETWGTGVAVHLLGDFAFALWDPRCQRLFCARDTSGQRTVFYHVDERMFAAATEIHQLLQDPRTPVVANEDRIRDFLVPANVYRNPAEHPATFYTGISCLEAGHTLVVDRGRWQTRRYWQLETRPELRYRHKAQYAEHYLELLTTAVAARLRSSRPVGALLSGGLDSSSIVCVAKELAHADRLPSPGLVGISLVYDGLECDERDLIQDIQAKYGLDVSFLRATEYAWLLQPEPRGFVESPYTKGTDLMDAMSALACQAGARVVLTGEIADSCVAGLPAVFDSLLRKGRLLELWQYLHWYQGLSGESWRRTIALLCLAPLLPLSLHRALMLRYTARALRRAGTSVLPEWIADPLRADLLERQFSVYQARERGRRFSNPARHAELQWLYPPEETMQPVGWPLEMRHPFADRRLHEFLLALPPEVKFATSSTSDTYYARTKRLVRDAMRGIVPERIRVRPIKTVFDIAVAGEIGRNWPVYESVFGPGARPHVVARGYVDQPVFWSRLEQVRSGRAVGDLTYIMRIVALESWLRGVAQPRPRATTVLSLWDSSQSQPDLLRSVAAEAPLVAV